MPKRMQRKPLAAGKFEDVEKVVRGEFKKLSVIERLSYPIYFHFWLTKALIRKLGALSVFFIVQEREIDFHF